MKTTDTTTFIENAIKVHGGRYDYSKAVYVDSKTKITLVCPIHGEFTQSPNNHLTGYGCKECGKTTTRNKQSLTSKEFVEKAKSIHGSKYDYSLVVYKNTKTNVTIMCPDHGPFEQAPSNHTHKTNPQGCPTCGALNRRAITGWTTTEWELAGQNSDYFAGFKLYVIKCWKDSETFYKIGKTYREVYDRFRNKVTMPYEWELILTKEGSAQYISDLENSLHALNKQHKYTPKLPFGGQYECYSKIQQVLDSL
jgi:rubrerythrin